MTRLLLEAGFTGIEERAVDDIMDVAADRRIWSSSLERNYADLLVDLTVEQRNALDAKMQAAFEPFRQGDVYRLHSEARLGIGVAPSRS